MKHKLLLLLSGLAFSTFAFSATLITWDRSVMEGHSLTDGQSFTYAGITLTANGGEFNSETMDWDEPSMHGASLDSPDPENSFTFSSAVGNLLRIDIWVSGPVGVDPMGGEWTEEFNVRVWWTGDVASIDFKHYALGVQQIDFYVDEGSGVIQPGYYSFPSSAITPLAQLTPDCPAGQDYTKLFDGDNGSKWCCTIDGGGAVAVWKTDDPIILIGYQLTTGNDNMTYWGRNWKDWTVYGANFASDAEAEVNLLSATGWTIVHQVTGDTKLQDENYANYSYAFENTNAFQYYKVVITANKSDWPFDHSTIQMSEMRLRYAPTSGSETILANEDPDVDGEFYSTFFDSFLRYTLPVGVEAYVAELSGDALLLTKIAEEGEVIPENTGVILKSTSSSYTLNSTDAAAVTFTATNNLWGVNDITATPSNCYVLSGHSTDYSVEGLGFYHYTGANLKAHKAYARRTSGGGAGMPPKLRFVFNGTTGIEETNDAVKCVKYIENGMLVIEKNGVRYNVQGQTIK